ncbi:MAG: hypothetical protein JNM84_16530 [Planctomycetes bacterium]|nr:hypothetical protein [Planctomycetota bacterium]
MLLRFSPCVLAALLLFGLHLERASLAAALFALVAILPLVALAASAADSWRARAIALGAASLPLAVAATCWGGFSSGNPPEAHLGSLTFLGVGLAALPLGLVELAGAFGVRRSAVVAGFLLLWSALVSSPFFLPSFLGAQLDWAREAEVAAWIASVHPFAAACDAAGGLDGFRDPALYDRAEIGARHAYRYPSSASYAAFLWGVAASGAAVRFTRDAWRARRLFPTETP